MKMINIDKILIRCLDDNLSKPHVPILLANLQPMTYVLNIDHSASLDKESLQKLVVYALGAGNAIKKYMKAELINEIKFGEIGIIEPISPVHLKKYLYIDILLNNVFIESFFNDAKKSDAVFSFKFNNYNYSIEQSFGALSELLSEKQRNEVQKIRAVQKNNSIVDILKSYIPKL
jgi:hypothetical protein